MTGRIRKGQQGFSLLEILVAFSIMAMSVGLLYRALAGSVRDIQRLDGQLQASVLADSLLALRESVPLQGWQESGVSGPYQWRVQSVPHTIPAQLTQGPQALEGTPLNPRLHKVNLLVEWQADGKLQAMAVTTLLPVVDPAQGRP